MRQENFGSGWTFCKRDKEDYTDPASVTLPHDATILEKRSKDAPSANGGAFFPGGYYIYRKSFYVPETWRQQDVILRFEGVYPKARVYVNDLPAGRANRMEGGDRTNTECGDRTNTESGDGTSAECGDGTDKDKDEDRYDISYGYGEYYIPLARLRYGEVNTVRVEVDATGQPDSRWYAGAGIYRPVWLITGSKEHIVPDGIRVTTLSLAPPTIQVEVQHTLSRGTGKTATLQIEVFGKAAHTASAPSSSGKFACAETGETTDGSRLACERMEIAEGSGQNECINLALPEAALWDAEHPNLYTCTVTLLRGDEILDTAEVTFGIRILSWSPEGFRINGNSVLFRGGCIHHDNGILGARSYRESEWRRIRRLKEGGFNAIRSAHNPICRWTLEACDVLGMYVLDEGWDMWYRPKTAYDYAARFPAHYREDVAAMTRKDYNHPSVVMYSIGNEVSEPASSEGVQMAAAIAQEFRRCDATRPLTAGLNLTFLLPSAQAEEVSAQAEKPPVQVGELPVQAQVHAADGTADEENTGSGAGGGSREEPGDCSSKTDRTPAGREMNSTLYNQKVFENGAAQLMESARPEVDQASAPVLAQLDIAGYNYASSRYEMDGELHPDRVLLGTETFPYDLPSNWRLVERLPYLIGDFMWTAWDHIGETGLGAWGYEPEDAGFTKPYPWLLSGAGAYDILGDDTAEAGQAAIVWRQRPESAGAVHAGPPGGGTFAGSEPPYIGVRPVNHMNVEPLRAMWRRTDARPHWSYRGCEGNDAVVEVYTRGAEVALYLNGECVGREAVSEEYKAVFHTIYRSGSLRAIACDENGMVIGERTLYSAGPDIHIAIAPETPARMGELLYVNIDLRDADGTLECNRDTLITLRVTGARLLAFGSANPKTEEGFHGTSHTTYYGRSQAVLFIETREITICAGGEGFGTAALTLTASD